jgi:hypothetical protein
VESTKKELVENNIKERFQHLSASKAIEIDKPLVPVLARCSIEEKKVEVH